MTERETRKDNTARGKRHQNPRKRFPLLRRQPDKHQPKPTEKNINTAAVEKMMAGATEDFKPGLQPKQPTEKNINTAAVEKMMADRKITRLNSSHP